MTIATFLRPRRRWLLLGAATVALHYLTIAWVGTQLGQHEARRRPPPSLVTAQLHLALPQHREAAPLPELQPLSAPAPKPAPKPARRPAPPPPAPEPAPAPTPAPAPEPAPPVADSNALSASAGQAQAGADSAPAATQPQAGADQATPGAAPAPTAQTSDAPPAPPVQAPGQGMRRYKVNLPPSADFLLDVRRVDANGTKWTGEAAMKWHTDGGSYTLSVEAGISMLITRLNLLVLTSTGTIDDFGIAPVTATEKRSGRSQTATHFNRDEGTITFSASERSYPLLVGAQDKATVPFQLGAIGRADPNQFGTDIDILVGEDKEANIFRFQLVGEEELETGLGKLQTWHLTRPPKPGTYSSRLDVWLAPSQYWYPVQIRNTEASGALTTQTVSRITITNSGK
ncbi:DUF3108 domain-containing protein [Duganella sp. FT3S]|uniref:DUF3108 domain-containing protein n=1 Tax=Rugamonas fusca TaxID=2758568 RepID=A0A7W2EHJ7_9BURK|nr:DUF3108 domain-containing protein [Rugamonas fusca]MBA5605922.1 DUF3108 domain-containing protein [Rugamonas fusca]